MMQIIPQSAVLNCMLQAIMHLKWAWDYLLYCQSFFQNPNAIMLPDEDDSNVTFYKEINDGGSAAECAVCLCKIDGDDEVRELRCDHFFHRVCLDRWLGYGKMTCPVCRNNLKMPSTVAELHQELIMIEFCATRYTDDRDRWWLR